MADLVKAEKVEAPVVPVYQNVTRMLAHHLEAIGVSLNGQESKLIIDSIVKMIANGGQLPEEVSALVAAREAEAADHLKQTLDAIEKNKPK